MSAITDKPSARERIMDAAARLVHEQGFHATTVDAIIAEAKSSKGAFFHHFSSKEELGDALLDRYAAADAAMLDDFMTKAELATDDSAEQIVYFLQQFQDAADDITTEQPGCLFASFIYERGPGVRQEHDVILESIQLWRARFLKKLERAATTRPELVGVDLESLADTVFSTFEGGFILVRGTGDRSQLGRQLGHLRRYLELLLRVETPIP
jgi:TetR/AcrR family transcriptional repressor of nem operon